MEGKYTEVKLMCNAEAYGSIERPEKKMDNYPASLILQCEGSIFLSVSNLTWLGALLRRHTREGMQTTRHRTYLMQDIC